MPTFTGRPAVSGDDGYSTAPATFDNNDDYTVVGQAGGAVSHSFFRVPSVNIAKGENIISAKLTFKAFNAQTGTTTYFNIYMNDHDDAVAPTSFAELAALDLTTAFSAWDSEEVWVENSTYDSPGFADQLLRFPDADTHDGFSDVSCRVPCRVCRRIGELDQLSADRAIGANQVPKTVGVPDLMSLLS